MRMLLALLVSGGALQACGDDASFSPDGSLLRFDAAMLAHDSGSVPDVGDTDAGSSDAGLDVVDSGPLDALVDVGMDVGMDAGPPTVDVRLCHCIYTSASMSPVELEMTVGDTRIGPTRSNVCSPCTPVPLGSEQALEIIRTATGEVLRSGTLELDGTVPRLGVIFSVGVFTVRAVSCEPTSGFCS